MEDSRPVPMTAAVDVSDDDVYEAMKEVQGYLDITPGDLKIVMHVAYRHALARLSRMVKARDIMTAHVNTTTRQAELRDVARLMAEKRISGVPVLEENGSVAGIISIRDFLAHMGMKDRLHLMDVIAECLRGERCLTAPILDKKAEDIMTSPAICVGEDTPLSEIAGLLTAKKIGRVPVTDSAGRLLGIVSKTDLVRIHLMQAGR